MVSIIIAVAVATWAYFGIIERLNSIETEQTLMSADLEKNTEFRIKWPEVKWVRYQQTQNNLC